MTRFLATLAAVSALVVGVLVPTASASAAPSSGSGVSSRDIRTTLVGFDAGNIISDAVFFNSSSMSAPQIQTFLNSKVPTCRTGGDQYGPYVCLKDYKIGTQTKAADQYCRGYEGAAIETAAQIIAKVAQSCRINPQVLLVMLQKEQSLVLNVWPSAWRYEIAMGHECPDFRECNPAKKGFLNQVYGAARQMQIYAEGKYFTYYAPGKTWNIRYSPDVNCGSSPVYVANVATSAMYYYTPYQPNAAALAAGTGEAPCGAYGNRNFYNYFTDWFGSTHGDTNNPFGNVEVMQASPGEFRIGGWVADRNTTEPLAVHIYVGSSSGAYLADLERPDVAAAYPGTGTKHGFDVKVPATGESPVNVCVYAMNAGSGVNVLLGCQSMGALTGSPIGAFDAAEGIEGGINVRGWAIDPDS
ncbi:MAG: hypothetical protein JF592_15545, partial [Microbacterium sp.]|nr:hypothetical protein [Microbacterium sp.]